ncbi:YraN family protein [Endozoicomonas montiporae]|uniref:UPF0102 protein EZMO1_3179 n=1 Tax=Endozoicomonas montiporae CL-33 TaxID=570277 RepID=A0A142BEK8_9GAMM|nr:YraN family protein [Endozoicomonas montiporae]AMO57184.1 putative endonuclease [Endozoicomonas montiporae CL-33]
MYWRLSLRNKTGARAEHRALHHLKANRLKLVDRNYACRSGELDLIMLDGETLVFIEVRSRNSLAFGGASASITPKKQQKMRQTAAHFLQNHRKHQHRHCRFDAVLIFNPTGNVTSNAISSNDERLPKPIEWLQGIF